MEWLVLVLAGLFGGAAATWLTFRSQRRGPEERLARAEVEVAALRHAGERDAAAVRRGLEAAAREESLAARAQAESEEVAADDAQARREERVAQRAAALDEDGADVARRLDELAAREQEITTQVDATRQARASADRLRGRVRSELERVAEATAAVVKQQLCDAWLDDARADAAQLVRQAEANPADPEWGQKAKRIMGIAVHRYQGHYLTERLLSNIPLPPGIAGELADKDGLLLHAIETGSGVKLELAETGERVRIDSGDGVAREIARRALARLIKGTMPKDKEPEKWVQGLGQHLDREIVDLGRKAFAELAIPRAHPDIVKLVGRLNYRTSYTQNQWKHALEAAFLGGMMAAEMGLDVSLARRATLMHDIGKALTHEIDGSHAVIGADYARRLGEAEVVANAIGAHHADEPPNSVYAYLVAAADAMSGARPGARREQQESYSTRLEDLERIGAGFRGVDEAVAVQGGREVRVYVREREVDDLRAVELSGEIAKKISDEMTFPGQIKVTVIRNFEAVETAN
jgi:ribonuclease Y